MPLKYIMALQMKKETPQNLWLDESFTIVIKIKFKIARTDYKYCHKEQD